MRRELPFDTRRKSALMTDTAKYYEALDRCVKRLPELGILKNWVYSIALYGSLPRGDFLAEVSDVDLFVILEWPAITSAEEWESFDEISGSFSKFFLDCFKEVSIPRSRGYLLDLVMLSKEHLPFKEKQVRLDPDFDYVVFKYFGVYSFDIPNWKIIYGEDFRTKLNTFDSKALAPAMAKNIIDRIDSTSSAKEVLGYAAHALRLAQVYYGEPTLDKRKILANFHRYVPQFPLKDQAVEIYGLAMRMNLISEEAISRSILKTFIHQLLKPLVDEANRSS